MINLLDNAFGILDMIIILCSFPGGVVKRSEMPRGDSQNNIERKYVC